jgi:hypothetical protein
MAETASGTFVLPTWEEDAFDQAPGAVLKRVRNTKDFSGGFAGSSASELLIVQAEGGGAAYVGLERASGDLGGHEGTFVLHHDATSWSGATTAIATIVPGSGTGELEGLTGRMEIQRHEDGSHTYVLEYELPG